MIPVEQVKNDGSRFANEAGHALKGQNISAMGNAHRIFNTLQYVILVSHKTNLQFSHKWMVNLGRFLSYSIPAPFKNRIFVVLFLQCAS